MITMANSHSHSYSVGSGFDRLTAHHEFISISLSWQPPGRDLFFFGAVIVAIFSPHDFVDIVFRGDD